MHQQNPYSSRYDLERLVKYYPLLQKHIVLNPSGEETIDFLSSTAVYSLNKAMLLADFKLEDYDLPMGYLIPPVPGRLDYLLHMQDFLSEKLNNSKDTQLRGLDIGAGANGIYCILGAQHFNWKMVGIESDLNAISIANINIQKTKELQDKVKILHQENKSFLFKNIIKVDDKFDFLVCNPPFHNSKEEAIKGTLRKLNNLGDKTKKKKFSLNFEGQANELWCNGGEILFIKRLIKESAGFKDQIKIFSTLVAKKTSLPTIEKQLNKVKAEYSIVPMALGNKKGRYVMWWFENKL
jgi:23S rRNA (adenine1618-N6)-methyltransferase